MSATIIIPARYAARRFPAKLMQPLGDMPVIQHTWLAACATSAKLVAVATDNQQLAEVARGFGAQVVLTGEHPSGSDRVCQAAQLLGLHDDELVINLQGDEPLFASSDIDRLIDELAHKPDIGMASMMHPLTSEQQFASPNSVKVVVNSQMKALYFSRAGIPFARNQLAHTPWLHQGIYAFRLVSLKRLVALPPCALEQLEQLEQLRALYNGISIHMVQSLQPAHPGIDTPADLDYAKQVLATRR